MHFCHNFLNSCQLICTSKFTLQSCKFTVVYITSNKFTPIHEFTPVSCKFALVCNKFKHIEIFHM